MARILIVGKYYPPFSGGIENYTAYVAEKLAERHEVVALVSNHHLGPGYQEELNGVTVIRRRLVAIVKSQPIYLGVFSKIRLTDFDVIHFMAPNPYANLFLLLAGLLQGGLPPLVITHNMDIYGRKLLRAMVLPLYKTLLKRATTIIVHSLKNVAISDDLPKDKEYAEVMLGVDLDKYQLTAGDKVKGADLRRSLCGDAPTLLFIGRHARYKGLEVLIRTLQSLDGVHALIAGDGPLREGLQEMARDLGIDRRVHFLGRVPDERKNELFAAADIFVFPSTEVTEVFGIAQAEAMAAGLAVVASNLPTGVTDLAIDGQTALLAEPGDSVGLARQIERLIADPKLRQALATRAQAHIHANFNEAVVSERTAQIIEEAVVKRTQRRQPC